MFTISRSRLRRCGTALAVVMVLSACAGAQAMAQERTYEFNIPAEDTTRALNDFSRQTGIQILFPYDVVAGRSAPAISGKFTSEEVLSKLLEGSGLEIAARTEKSITLRPVAVGPKAESGTDGVTEVIVTGTHLRGGNPTSPVHTITRTDIDRSGYSQIGDLMRSLPEDFSGGQNPGVIAAGSSNIGNQNITNSSSINLRGLGTDATLVLLNGHRLSGDSFFQGADISTIPLSALQRVEVVTDGASAIYGSDAVAGVVNFMVRKNYTGTELGATTGVTSQGGGEQENYHLLSGIARPNWYALVAAEYARQGEITAGDRDMTAAAPPEEWIYRPQKRSSVFVSAGAQLNDKFQLTFDGLFAERNAPTLTKRTATAATTIGAVYTPSYSAALTADIKLSETWNLRLTGVGSGSRNETWSGRTRAAASYTHRKNDVQYVEATANGTLFELPTGDVKAAFGGGYRQEEYRNNLPGSSTYYTGGRRVSYGYAEILAPLVTPSESRVGLEALELSLSGRAEKYSDFGSTANPRLGLRYVPFSDVTLRAAWAPHLRRLRFSRCIRRAPCISGTRPMSATPAAVRRL